MSHPTSPSPRHRPRRPRSPPPLSHDHNRHRHSHAHRPTQAHARSLHLGHRLFSDRSSSHSSCPSSSSSSCPSSSSSSSPSNHLPGNHAAPPSIPSLATPTSTSIHSSDSGDPYPRLRLFESHQQPYLRHGFDTQDQPGHYSEALGWSYSVYWDDSPYRSLKASDMVKIPFWSPPPKHRTACAALFLCLRLGYDPPDVVKTSPAPRLEAWTDPKLLPKETVLESIGKRLQEQFECLAPTHARVKFKTYADVYAEEFKKTLIGLRKYSKTDRCLIYYNGHGVPKPTPTGEIWVFNKAYTQYIPISVSDILSWVGPPVVFVWDCNNAGHILRAVIAAGQKKDQDLTQEAELRPQSRGHHDEWTSTGSNLITPALPPSERSRQQHPTTSAGSACPAATKESLATLPTPHSSTRYADTIQLAACAPDQMLPLDPNLPADVFTSCLTSPVEMALRFYVLRNNSQHAKWTSTCDFFDDLSKLDKVPGRMEMRRTPLGELTWIFTSIADAIAWNHLDRQLFTKIFRGDLVLAGTFRGFLLAERVMKSYGCTPMSAPKLPTTHHSDLWQCWDLEVDMCLSQLLEIWKSEAARAQYDAEKSRSPPNTLPPTIVTYKPSTFFSQQLTAFELWLKAVVAQNPNENGERDEDYIRKQESLRWCCNDWSGVRMSDIHITDFACSHAPTRPTLADVRHPSSASVPVKRRSVVRGGSRPLSQKHQAHPACTGAETHPEPPPEHYGPIRYKLPEFIKHFPLNSRPADDFYPPSPPQLPIVLQVLLSPLHRLRALRLLCRLMDLGPWTVHLSLSIGIFQYVLKLLQAPAAELKPVLICIWARILTVYPDGRQDLFRFHVNRQNAPPDAPIEYFIKVMAPDSIKLPSVSAIDHKAMCAFILSIGCKNSKANAKRLMHFGVMEIIMYGIKELMPSPRQWYLVLLAHLWEESDAVKGRAIKMGINTILCDLLTDKVPEVRTAALYAFGTLIGVSTSPTQIEVQDDFPEGGNSNQTPDLHHSHPPTSPSRPVSVSPSIQRFSSLNGYQANKLNSLSSSNPAVTNLGYQEQILIEVGSAMACCHCSVDGSPVFRQELIVVLSALVDQHLGHFIVAAFEACKQEESQHSMPLSQLLRAHRSRKPAWSDHREYEGAVDSVNKDEEFGEVENAMTDRTAKLEKLIAKLKCDEEIHPQESLRAYLWMECATIYTVLLDLCLDPSAPVSDMAKVVVDYIHSRLVDSVLGAKLGLDDLSTPGALEGASSDLKRQQNGSIQSLESNCHTRLVGGAPSSSDPSSSQKWGSSYLHSNRSTTVLNTVNNLVPNFVRPPGWRTPFGAMSRSPEQGALPLDDSAHGSSGTRTNPDKTELRKSASLNPTIITTEDDCSRTTLPPRRAGSPHDPSSGSDTSPQMDITQKRLRLSSSQPLESIIACTRAADHIRRQANRSYILQPTLLSPGSSSLPPAHPPRVEEPNLSDRKSSNQEIKSGEQSSVGSDEVAAGGEADFLYYLGLQDLEGLEQEVVEDGGGGCQGNKENCQRASKTKLPLRSNYYDISAHAFLKPRMFDPPFEEAEDSLEVAEPHRGSKDVMGNEKGGIDAIKAAWRRQRNRKIIAEGQRLKTDKIVRQAWDWPEDTWSGPSPITNVLMHQFENHIITSDTAGYITVYESGAKEPLNRYRNSNTRPTRITSLELMNENDVALVLAATADGNVRIYRNYTRLDRIEVVTAFKALPNNEPSTHADSGVVTNWQQSTGLLVVGGNAREIRVWNSKRESCVENIKTRSNSCLTSLTTDRVMGHLIGAGFGDGSVRIYDRRLPLKSTMVKVYRGFHSSWVNGLKMQDGGRRELVSGDTVGDLGHWDIRFDSPIKMMNLEPSGMPTMDLHDHWSILASGSVSGKVKVWELKIDQDNSLEVNYSRVAVIRPLASSSVMGEMPSVVTSLSFHPWKTKIAVGYGDGGVRVYGNHIP